MNKATPISVNTDEHLMANQLQLAERESVGLLVVAQEYVIDSHELAEIAAKDLRRIAAMKKQLNEDRLELTRPLDAVKTALMDKYRPHLERLDRADEVLRAAITKFQRAERERQEAERAEQERIREEERRELEKKLEKAKTPEKQAAIAAAIEESSMEMVPDAAPTKLAGISTRTTWRIKSIDLLALVQAAAKNPKLLIYLEARDSEIGKVARALGENFDIPGVTVEQVDGLAVRR